MQINPPKTKKRTTNNNTGQQQANQSTIHTKTKMDGQLSSSRHGHYGNGGGDGGYHRRGRGRGRGGYHNHRRGRGYHRDRDDRRHHPYRRGGGRHGGGRRNPGNRFDNNSSTKSVDPQSAMLKQLTAMVAKMGDLISCAESAKSMGLMGADSNPSSRGVVEAIARNIQDLVVVLCSAQNAPLFLKFGGGDGNDASEMEGDADANVKVKADEEAGPLATLITSCAATLPLQSPSYVGLTLGVEEHAPEAGDDTSGVSYKGFAQRCVTMACRRLADDLDTTCGVVPLLVKEDSSGTKDTYSKGDEYVNAFMRSKLLLRYFALLSRAGVISAMESGDEDIGDRNITELSSLSLGGILQLLTEASARAKNTNDGTKASKTSLANVSILLSALVLSTIPYAMHVLSKKFVDGILSKIDEIVEAYESPFKPGVGIMSILLEKAQFEEPITSDDADDEEEEEEDDDEDDDDEGSPVCADTFQDLVRTVRKLVDSFYISDSMPSRFALLSDAPWSSLKGKEEEFAPMEGDTEEDILNRKNASKALYYSGEKLYISIPDTCHLFRHLLGGDAISMGGVPVTLQCSSTEGIIYGRLNIFDPPPEDDDDEDEEKRDPAVDTYVKNFTMLDRFFLSDSIRDCLVCHRPLVSDTGVARGSSKEAAEQIWAVCELFTTPNGYPTDASMDVEDVEVGDNSKGVECGVVETILSLVVQCPRGVESVSPMSHIYLCRVLIELAKFQPTRVPQSLAVATSDLFNDFIPSFSPISKENLSHWFAYHLTNTDYQWPQSYWNAWTPYVVEGTKEKRNSRGEFITKTIQNMASFVETPKTIVRDCLPVRSKLSGYIIHGQRGADAENKSSAFGTALETVENDIKNRIWKNSEEPEDVQTYLIGDEVAETIQGSMDDDIDSSSAIESDKIWWRLGLIVRSILSVADEMRKNLQLIVEESSSSIEMDDREVEIDPSADMITDITDYLKRFKSVILASMAKDIQVHEVNLDLRGESKKSESEMVLMGEEYILRICDNLAGFSSPLFKTCIELLMKQKIVSAKGVLRWIFGANGERGNEALASHGWWNMASTAIRLAIDDFVSDRIALMDSDGTDIGMIIDTGGEDEGGNSGTPSARRMKKVTEFVSPLLQYASERVHTLLKFLKEEKKLSHYEADLKEGLKILVRSITAHLVATLKDDDTVKATTELGGPSLEVETWVAKCAFDENMLAALS